MSHPIHPKRIRAQRAFRLKALTGLLVLCTMTYAAYWLWQVQGWVITNDAYVTGNVVTLKSPATGIVTEILTENTQEVRAGETLIRLDGNRARVSLEQAKAELADTTRQVAMLFNQVQILRQRIATQQATRERIRHDLHRYRFAARADAVSAQQAQNTEDQLQEVEAAIKQTEAELVGANARVADTTVANHPLVAKAANALRGAFLEFERQNVLAPVSGVVAKRRVQIGDHVQPGTPLLAIVPLAHLWVEANLKETQIAQIRPGQPAEITVDAYGSGQAVFRGTVEGLHAGTGSLFALLPPENASGNYIHVVERLPVRIALHQDDIKTRPLRPGLSTLTRIDITHPGNNSAVSTTTTNYADYSTVIYAHELERADTMVEEIVRANSGVMATSITSLH